MTSEINIERTWAKNRSNYDDSSVGLVYDITEVFVVVMNSIQFRVKDILWAFGSIRRSVTWKSR